MEVKNAAGAVIGVVTSGTFSPTLKKGIALALLDNSIKLSDQVIVDVRGRDCVAEVTKLPLVNSNVR
jgi:aminomethyltransferase